MQSAFILLCGVKAKGKDCSGPSTTTKDIVAKNYQLLLVIVLIKLMVIAGKNSD